MRSIKTLQDTLLSVAQDTQKSLSTELDGCMLPVHKFSRGYLKRKRMLLRSQDKNIPVLSFRKRILIPLVIIMTISAGVMSVPAIREPVITFIVNVCTEMTDFIIRTDDDQPKIENINFTLGYVPEGFTLKNTQTNPNMKEEIYEDNSQHNFIFAVENYKHGINFSMDSENAVETHTRINGYDAVIMEKSTGINIALFDRKNCVVWNLTGKLNLDTALKIIKNAKINIIYQKSNN